MIRDLFQHDIIVPSAHSIIEIAICNDGFGDGDVEDAKRFGRFLSGFLETRHHDADIHVCIGSYLKTTVRARAKGDERGESPESRALVETVEEEHEKAFDLWIKSGAP
jgi:hypothetical protein